MEKIQMNYSDFRDSMLIKRFTYVTVGQSMPTLGEEVKLDSNGEIYKIIDKPAPFTYVLLDPENNKIELVISEEA